MSSGVTLAFQLARRIRELTVASPLAEVEEGRKPWVDHREGLATTHTNRDAQGLRRLT